jgi:hypothetical protein
VTRFATLVTRPDLDGDQPAHHAQADRAFRWAEAIVFLVTPEKYQMTELCRTTASRGAMRGRRICDEQGRAAGGG